MRVELTARDMLRLKGVHPDLVKIVNAVAADSPLDFFIIQGVRTEAEQLLNVQAGKSQTMNSRHIHGFAVDFGVRLNGALTWEHKYYEQLAAVFLARAASLNIPIVYGGAWKTLKDYDHVELNRNFYPDHKSVV